MFSPQDKRKTTMSSLVILIIKVLEVIAREIREEKEIEGIKVIKEEIKLSLFADNMILYIENPKNTPKETAGYKINI